MKLPVVDESVAGKRVFVRGDIDVPLSPFDDTRLRDIKPTIDFLLEKNCTVYLAGHLGRPGGKIDPGLSSRPIQDWFGNNVKVLENLRFDSREEANDEGYAKELASLADVYVNEAFAASYESHTSIVGVPKFLPHFAGFWLAKEVEVLNQVLQKPARPLLVIIGGAKVDSKVSVIAKMQGLADRVLVGGKIVTEVFPYAREHNLELNRDKVLTFPLTADFADIFPQAIYNARADFLLAQTIVWSGPFGKIEDPRWQAGTSKLIDLILQNKRAYKIVGGGDTVGFLKKLGLADKFDWVCSGGGSMLQFLAEGTLPGIEALYD